VVRGRRKALVVAGTLVASGLLAAPAHADPDGSITVGPRTVPGIPRVEPGLAGVNQRWFDDADGLWDPSTGTPDPRVLRILKQSGVRTVRYAGGTVANLYSHDASLTGGCQTSGGSATDWFAGLAPARTGYTLAQHQQAVRGTGAGTNLMLPMVDTDPDEAVRYVQAAVDGLDPQVQSRLVVEVGNEPYLANQRYWRSAQPREGLRQYVLGGRRVQDAGAGRVAGNDRLYAATGCDLRGEHLTTGTAGEQLRTRFHPVVADDSLRVVVDGQTWSPVADLGAHGVGAEDRVFEVDATTGVLTFGNGRKGARLPGGRPAHVDYTVDGYGFRHFYDALKSRVRLPPGVRLDVCASWWKPGFTRLMRAEGLPYDCLTVHSYSVVGRAGGAARKYEKLMAKATSLGEELQRLRRQVRRGGHPERYLAVTEYGTLRSPGVNRLFMDDVYRARLMMGQVRAGVEVGNLSRLSYLYNTYGDRVSRSTKSYLLQWLSELAGSQVRRVRVRGSNRIDVLATHRDRTVRLWVVNHRKKGTWTGRIDVPRAQGRSCVSGWRLHDPFGASTRAERPGRPDALQRIPVSRTGPDLTRSFPAHSVTVLELAPAGRTDCR
jgi:hypothetical protein